MQEQEEIKLSTEEKGWLGKIKESVYENWQTILVALIVLIVGISAYNYNEKSGTDSSPAAVQNADETKRADNTTDTANQEKSAETTDQTAASQKDQATSNTTNKDTAATTDASKQTASTPEATKETKTKADATVANTNAVVVEGENYKVTAVRGEGLTHLARKALNKYLEENKDDKVTTLHKIYIEDYLRKQVAKTKVNVGHQETFSKSLIAKAIASSEKLSQKDLNNLKKYEKNVK